MPGLPSEEQTLLVTTLKIRLDAREGFALWQEKMNKIVAEFPGFVSLEMRPATKSDWVEWSSIQRFRTHEELEHWRLSERRKKLIDELTPFLTDSKAMEEMKLQSEQKAVSVTEVFVTRVTPANYDAYRAWASKIQQIEAQFPGYQGIYIQAPEREKGGNWITILRFDSPEHLDAWLVSTERKAILRESENIVQELQSHRVISPFAGWFADIAKETGEVPAVWKQTMLVLLVLFPIVMLELKFLMPHFKGLNPSLGTFIGNAISVTLVSWPMMPLAIRCLNGWLSPGCERRMQKIILGTLFVAALYLIEIVIFWRLLP